MAVRHHLLLRLYSLSALWSVCTIASAFASPKVPYSLLSSSSRLKTKTKAISTPSTTTITSLRAGGSSDDFSELTSALARLDQQWSIQQRSKRTKSRWSKLILPNDPKADEKEEHFDQESTSSSSTSSSSTSIIPDLTRELSVQEYVWILEPPGTNSIPSCIILFTGGAGLGQFPHIAYNELLSKISNRLNAAIIAAPYQVGLDHFGLAKQTGERLRRAVIHCQDDPSRQYSPSLPIYCMAHSLGCKLQTIYMGATGQVFDGIGFMSFNNFSFGQTIGMARMFAKQILNNYKSNQDDIFNKFNMVDNDEMLNTIFAFAENIVGAIGVDFSPNAKDTERLIQLRYDDVLQSKTRLFVFDEDDLDNSKEFVENCSGGSPDGGPSVSGLPGGHLAPVFFKLSIDDIDFENLPSGLDAKEMAQEAMGGFQSASFGDEEALEGLVQEVCSWILGKPPSRGPYWDKNDVQKNEPPKLITGVSTSDD